TLSQPAPQGGSIVLLGSDSPFMKPPVSVTVPFRATVANVAIPTVAIGTVTPVAAHLSATQGTSRLVTTIMIAPPAIFSLQLNPTVVTGGIDNAVGTITLTSPAPGGFVVTLSTNDPD